MSEMARASEVFGIQSKLHGTESGFEDAVLIVRKYDGDMANWVTRKSGLQAPKEADFQRFKIRPYQEVVAYGNGITTAGWSRILDRAVGGTAQGWASGSCRIGVGTGTAATAVGDTELGAASGATANRFWQTVDAVGSTGTGGGTVRLSVVATFASANANFTWAEWGIDQGGTATATATTSGAAVAPLLNHKVQALGTKASPAVWTATAQLDFT